MSTKCTIGYGDTHHLYEECFDPDKVWLRLDGKDFEAEVGTRQDTASVTVGIDVTVWRKIVEAWLQSHWARHPERDHEKVELDLDSFEELLTKLKSSSSEGT